MENGVSYLERILGKIIMKKQNVGLALILLGIIFAIPVDTMLWWIGVFLGIIGFIIVASNSVENN